jgi:hypothetical protein
MVYRPSASQPTQPRDEAAVQQLDIRAFSVRVIAELLRAFGARSDTRSVLVVLELRKMLARWWVRAWGQSVTARANA